MAIPRCSGPNCGGARRLPPPCFEVASDGLDRRSQILPGTYRNSVPERCCEALAASLVFSNKGSQVGEPVSHLVRFRRYRAAWTSFAWAGVRRVGSQSVEPSMQESRFLFMETCETCLISSGLSAETSHPDNPCRQFCTLESGLERSQVSSWTRGCVALDWGAGPSLPPSSPPAGPKRGSVARHPYQSLSIFLFCHEDHGYWYYLGTP